MTARRFPVHSDAQRKIPGCPFAVPWSMLAPHERQAQRNHDQSLERLAERGGLSPCEMLAVLEDRRWSRMADMDALAQLSTHLLRWHDATQEAEHCLNCEHAYPDCECTGGPLVDWRQY